jgi:hypothetical protein
MGARRFGVGADLLASDFEWHTCYGQRKWLAAGQSVALVWTVRDGKLVRVEVFTDRREALAAVGLRA